jgi:hypothetical protein
MFSLAGVALAGGSVGLTVREQHGASGLSDLAMKVLALEMTRKRQQFKEEE